MKNVFVVKKETFYPEQGETFYTGPVFTSEKDARKYVEIQCAKDEKYVQWNWVEVEMDPPIAEEV